MLVDMCQKHQKPAVGKTCGTNYCLECSQEYQEFLKQPGPKPPTTVISWINFHGKIIWKIGEQNG